MPDKNISSIKIQKITHKITHKMTQKVTHFDPIKAKTYQFIPHSAGYIVKKLF